MDNHSVQTDYKLGNVCKVTTIDLAEYPIAPILFSQLGLQPRRLIVQPLTAKFGQIVPLVIKA